MKVSQVATLINSVTSEIIGDSAVINEDLSNVVDVGKAIFDNTSYDNFVRSLVDHIGRVIFVDRTYTGNTLAIKRDSWEYGSVLEKIAAGLPAATENETWELTDGASYDPNVFTKPEVMAKFYDKRVTFEIPLSIADKQVKSAFSSASQLNAFVSMLWGMVDKSMQVKLEGLASRTINSMIGATIAENFGVKMPEHCIGESMLSSLLLMITTIQLLQVLRLSICFSTTTQITALRVTMLLQRTTACFHLNSSSMQRFRSTRLSHV